MSRPDLLHLVRSGGSQEGAIIGFLTEIDDVDDDDYDDDDDADDDDVEVVANNDDELQVIV